MFGDALSDFHRPGLERAGEDELEALTPEPDRGELTLTPGRPASRCEKHGGRNCFTCDRDWLVKPDSDDLEPF